jgi:MoaA/NifB/PqqE/SkfB family radical SAM enzyme
MAAAGWYAAKARAVAAAQPLNVLLELTYACNWACVFCYNPRRHDLRRLSAAEWAAVLDELRALGTFMVTLTGGEPLLHPEFLDIAAAVRQRSFSLRVFTNGALVDEAMAASLAALDVEGVEMSLHGACAETHDRTTGRPGSFDAMMAGIGRLRARGVPVTLKTPLTRLNEGELEAMIALAAQLQLPYRLNPTLTPRDDGDRGPLGFRASSAGIERLYRRLADADQLPAVTRETGGVNCGLGTITMAIDPEGHVFPCIQWRASTLGNVRERPLRDIWTSSTVRVQTARVAQAANDLLVENGGDLAAASFCPALAAQRTGDPLTPDADHVEIARLAGRVRHERA